MKRKNPCHENIPVVINGQYVEEVEDFKYLGTYFDSTLSFTVLKTLSTFLKRQCSAYTYLES